MRCTIAVGAALCLIGAAAPAMANTIASSTMVFQGQLTDEGGGVYSGVIAMVSGGGFDVYAREGATAYFGDDPGSGPVWSSLTIGSDHDAWSGYSPDTPDWYQYSLHLYVEDGEQRWAVRNHPGATADHPWYDTAYWGSEKAAAGVPMSGTMDWTAMYAEETDTGAYLPGTGTPEIAGGAAGHGGGAHAWDMDWSWGSEVVPLQFPGFSVTVEPAGDGSLVGDYSVVGMTVTMTPVPIPAAAFAGGLLLSALGLLGLARRRRLSRNWS